MESKASRFELGLTLDLQGRLGGDTFTSLDHVFGKAAHLHAIRKREEGGKQGEKRKDNPNTEIQKFEKKHNGNQNHQDPQRNFGKGPNNNNNRNNNTNDRRSERVYRFRKCPNNHPGRDCEGNKVECRECGKLGRRAYECYSKNKLINPNGQKNGNYGDKPRNGNGNGNGNGGSAYNGNSNYSKPLTNTSNQTSNGNNTTNSQDKGKGKLYMMSTREQEARRDVVSGTFSINSTPVKVLFDSGASLSFIAHSTVRTLTLIEFESISMPIVIPSGETVNCSKRFLKVPLKIGESFFPSDLIEFNLSNLDVILGMDWLGKYMAKIDCDAQKVELRDPLGKRVSHRRIPRETGIKVINALQLKNYVDKGCPLFMCSVRRVEDDPLKT